MKIMSGHQKRVGGGSKHSKYNPHQIWIKIPTQGVQKTISSERTIINLNERKFLKYLILKPRDQIHNHKPGAFSHVTEQYSGRETFTFTAWERSRESCWECVFYAKYSSGYIIGNILTGSETLAGVKQSGSSHLLSHCDGTEPSLRYSLLKDENYLYDLETFRIVESNSFSKIRGA